VAELAASGGGPQDSLPQRQITFKIMAILPGPGYKKTHVSSISGIHLLGGSGESIVQIGM